MLYNSLPEKIVLDRLFPVILRPYVGKLSKAQVIEICKDTRAFYRKVKVLSKNLRGKTDLHGVPYKPSEWLFTSLPETFLKD